MRSAISTLPSSALPILTILVLLAAALTPGALPAEAADGDWPQWGGGSRDFQAAPVTLASAWSEGGPKELWRRELGDGNSGIAVVGDRLFTMYREDGAEAVVALDRATGNTVWETRWQARPVWETFFAQFGFGPHATPLIADGRLYTAGFAGRLVCLDAATGDTLWVRELWAETDLASREFGPLQLGYASSPLLHDGRLIVMGDPTSGVLAVLRFRRRRCRN